MKIVINNKITLKDMPLELSEELKGRLSFINPKWIENDRMGYWNGETPRTLKFYEVTDNGSLVIPRGFIRQLLSLCRREDVTFHIEDAMRVLPDVSFSFEGKLRPYQESAVSDVLGHDFGVLSSPTGSGKTVICLSVIAERRQPALVICHTKDLARQWADRANQFLGLPKDEIGLIGDGEMRIGKHLTIGIVNSVYKVAEKVSKSIGFLICDECHRCPSRTFTQAVMAFDCKYMLGLSATAFRRDGLSQLIFLALGDQVHKVERDALVRKGHVLPFEVITRETKFQTSYDPSEEYSKMLSELTQDHNRNALIVSDVVREANNGSGVCLVLSDRKNHCEEFKVLLRGHGIKADVLTGAVSTKDRQEIVERLNEGRIKVLIATSQLLSEGFDSKELSTLFLGTPIKFSGRLLQTVGRILRPAPGKKAKVIDYVDVNIPVLVAAAKSRQKVYGY